MNPLNRDLLVLTKKVTMSPSELEHEVEQLSNLLYHVENLRSFCLANEIFDLNRYKVIRKRAVLEESLRALRNKPFVFICNKN